MKPIQAVQFKQTEVTSTKVVLVNQKPDISLSSILAEFATPGMYLGFQVQLLKVSGNQLVEDQWFYTPSIKTVNRHVTIDLFGQQYVGQIVIYNNDPNRPKNFKDKVEAVLWAKSIKSVTGYSSNYYVDNQDYVSIQDRLRQRSEQIITDHVVVQDYLREARKISLVGDVIGSQYFNGSGDIQIPTTITVELGGQSTQHTHTSDDITDQKIQSKPNTIVKRDQNSDIFQHIVHQQLDGNQQTQTKFASPMTLKLGGQVIGQQQFDGSGEVTITTTLAQNYQLANHTHSEYSQVGHTHSEYQPLTHSHSEYSLTNHTHSGYQTTSHTHSEYSLVGHTHSYQPLVHSHSEYSPTGHVHTEYQPIEHTHDQYQLTTHTHAGFQPLVHSHAEYALTGHVHTNYQQIDHTHTEYQSVDHTHSEYQPQSHLHNQYQLTEHDHPQYQIAQNLQTQYQPLVHTHSQYSLTGHVHTEYQAVDHEHANYQPLVHSHPEYQLTDHMHPYQPLVHTHSEYSQTGHIHTEYQQVDHTHSEYSTIGHTHSEYQPLVHDHSNYQQAGHSHIGNDITDQTSEQQADKIVKRDANGDFSAGTISQNLNGNQQTQSKLKTPVEIAIAGQVNGSQQFDGSGSIIITVTGNSGSSGGENGGTFEMPTSILVDEIGIDTFDVYHASLELMDWLKISDGIQEYIIGTVKDGLYLYNPDQDDSILSDMLYIGTNKQFNTVQLDIPLYVSRMFSVSDSILIDSQLLRADVPSQFSMPAAFCNTQSFNQTSNSRLVIPVGQDKYAVSQNLPQLVTGPNIGGYINEDSFDPSYPTPRGIKPIILPVLTSNGIDVDFNVEGCRLVFTYQESSTLNTKRYVLGQIVGNGSPYQPGTIFARKINFDSKDVNYNLYYVCQEHHLHKVILSDYCSEGLYQNEPYSTLEESVLLVSEDHQTNYQTLAFPVSNTIISSNTHIDNVLGFDQMLSQNTLKICYSPATDELTQANINVADPNFSPTEMTVNDPNAGSIQLVPDDPFFGRYQIEFSNGLQYVKYDNQTHLPEIYIYQDVSIGLTVTSYDQDQSVPFPQNPDFFDAQQRCIYSFGEAYMNDGTPSGHQLYLLQQYGRTYIALILTLDGPFNDNDSVDEINEFGIYRQYSDPYDGYGKIIVGLRIQPNIGHSVVIRQHRYVDSYENYTLQQFPGITSEITSQAIEFGVDGNFIRIAYPQDLLRGLSSQQNFQNNQLPPIVLGYSPASDIPQFNGKIGRFQVQPTWQDFLIEKSYNGWYYHGSQIIMSPTQSSNGGQVLIG